MNLWKRLKKEHDIEAVAALRWAIFKLERITRNLKGGYNAITLKKCKVGGWRRKII